MKAIRWTPEQKAAYDKRRNGAQQPLNRAQSRDYPLAGVKAPKKYRNRPTGGYASVKEARRAEQLKLEQAAGAITGLQEQVRYELIPKQEGERACAYVCDFRYYRDGALVVEDVKSPASRTPEYIIKRKLMLQVHGIRIREI